MSVGAAGLRALRVNFVGELGYELHHPIEMQNYVFDALMAAGAEFGIKPFGIRAMDSLRLEKSYRLVGRELSIEYAGLRIRLASASSTRRRATSSAATRCWSGATRTSPIASSHSKSTA